MRIARVFRVSVAWIASLALPAAAAMGQGAHDPVPGALQASAPASPRYIRVIDDDANNRIRLEIAARSFQLAGGGPVVWLTGAVHIADRSFYDSLQNFLDEKDAVLFEGVKPTGAGSLEEGALGESDNQKAKATERRIHFLATVIEREHLRKGAYPATLADAAAGVEVRLAKIVGSSLQDAWGHNLIYTIRRADPADAKGGDAFDITSLGADGKPGGDGPDKDISYSQQTPVDPSDLEKAEGIQTQMAKAFGLVFQLDAMDHNKPNWRNSDMSIDQVQDLLEKAGADTGDLFKMLDGSSLGAKFLGVVLKIISLMPSVSEMGKMVLVDMLANADELLSAMPGGMGAMMDVIIKDRNQVVMNDLAKAVKEPGIRSVAIIYGAGHLSDMEKRLDQMGYRETGEKWFTAIDVDLAKTGMSGAQAKQIRQMIKQQIQWQIKAMKKAAEQP